MGIGEFRAFVCFGVSRWPTWELLEMPRQRDQFEPMDGRFDGYKAVCWIVRAV